MFSVIAKVMFFRLKQSARYGETAYPAACPSGMQCGASFATGRLAVTVVIYLINNPVTQSRSMPVSTPLNTVIGMDSRCISF